MIIHETYFGGEGFISIAKMCNLCQHLPFCVTLNIDQTVITCLKFVQDLEIGSKEQASVQRHRPTIKRILSYRASIVIFIPLQPSQGPVVYLR